MKMKKRLQALIAVAAMLSTIFISLSVFGTADRTTAETEVDLPGLYRASEAFAVTSGSNPPATPWSWEYYDTGSSTGEDTGGAPSSKYKLLTGGTYDNAFSGTGFPVPADDTVGGVGFKRDGNNNASTAVGKYWMTPDKNIAAAKKRYYAVRTFTAPKTGNITITAAGITDTDAGKILGQVKNTGDGANLRLMLQKGETNTQIWPAEGWQNVKRSGYVIFSPLTINIREGEKLHFEVADSTKSGSSNWDQAVYWDPVVRYNSFVTIQDFQPSVTEDLPLGQVFTFTTEDEIDPITESDVSITGTTEATVRDFSFTTAKPYRLHLMDWHTAEPTK